MKIGISVECGVCHKRKAPHGRSIPHEFSGLLCTRDCRGYEADPLSGCLWPGETAEDFGFKICEHATREMPEVSR